MKKFGFLFLAVLTIVLLCSFVSCSSNEDELPEKVESVGIEGLKYVLSEDETMYAIQSIGRCNLSEITLPTEYNGKPVKVIGSGAFALSNVEKIIIPEGYTDIYDLAFQKCKTLTSVTLPESLVAIGRAAFKSCTALSEITIPSSVVYLGNECFNSCTALSEITIPPSVVYLGKECFSKCSALATVNLGNNIKDFGEDAFLGTPIMSNPNNMTDGVRYIGNYIVSVDMESVPEILTIREGTVYIPKEAFSKCEAIRSVILPESMKYIGCSAFSGCNLEEINLPDAVEYIGAYAFGGCRVGVEVVGDGQYSQYIGNHLIYCYTKSSTLSIREGTLTIASGAINTHGELTTIRLPKSLKYISDNKLLGVSFPLLKAIIVDETNENYTSIEGVLYNKAITELIVCPPTKTGILIIPETVTTIHSDIFAGDVSQLEAIIIPKSVTQIKYRAFSGVAGFRTSFYYCGTSDEYKRIIKDTIWGSSSSNEATIFYYSENGQDNYSSPLWHYVDGVPTIWE